LAGLLFALSLVERSWFVINPFRSEQEAFRFLLYVAVVVALIVGVVFLVRALS
jgi:hypothetical protein